MQNKRFWKSNHYQLKIINRSGVSCISVIGSGMGYSTRGQNEPKGVISDRFKDKKEPRGRILTKLGLWGNGQILVPHRRH